MYICEKRHDQTLILMFGCKRSYDTIWVLIDAYSTKSF